MRGLRSLLGVSATAALVAALVGAPSVVPSAHAGPDVLVTMENMQFTPATATLPPLGGTVGFDNADDVETHKVLSDQGFFATADIPASASSTATVSWSGTFGYHCVHHPTMTGKVKAPMLFVEELVDGAKVRWAMASSPGIYTFDVQYRKNGTTTWRNFRVDTDGFKGAFRPSRSGGYKLRSRVHNVSEDKNSGWSPLLAVQVG